MIQTSVERTVLINNRIKALRDPRSRFEAHPSDYAYVQPDTDPWRMLPQQFVDFSTPYIPPTGEVLGPFKGTNRFIGDVSWTVHRYACLPSMLEFYKLFPLADVIGMLLAVSPERCDTPDRTEFFMMHTETRLGHLYYEVDIDELDTFYEFLTNELDNELTVKVPGYYHDKDFVFARWLDPVSLIMMRDPSPQSNDFWTQMRGN